MYQYKLNVSFVTQGKHTKIVVQAKAFIFCVYSSKSRKKVLRKHPSFKDAKAKQFNKERLFLYYSGFPEINKSSFQPLSAAIRKGGIVLLQCKS